MIVSSFIPHPSSFSSSDWLPIDQAADLLGLPLRTLRYRCANQWAKRGLAEQRPPAGGNGKPIWWIHRSVDPRLVPCPDRQTRQDQARESLLQRHPRHLVERAYRKAFWLDKWRKRCTRPRLAGQTERSIAQSVIDEAKQVEGPEFRISIRSLQTWWHGYNQLGDDGHILGVGVLIDGYNGPGTDQKRSPEAIDYFFSVYHSQARHSVSTCHKAVVAQAKRNGWYWPAAYSATMRWLRSHEDRAETCLHREGHGAYSHRHMQHLEIDYTTIEPGVLYICDHTPCDFWVSYRDRQIRPWLTAIEDCRSRCIVGWHLGPTPHQDAIVAAFRMAFRDWAVPRKVRIDRGKDFCSELIGGFTKAERNRHRRQLGPEWRDIMRHQLDVFFYGILGELSIEISEAIPYHPWAKGQVERFFGTFEDQCGKTFVTYCGNSAATKPECMPALRAGDDVPTLEEARLRVADWMELYHRQGHRGQGMDGLSPIAVWNTAARLRRAVESELMALMQARGVYRVGANGVSFKVGGSTLTYGAASVKLRPLAGRDVFITLDPDHCECCYAYSVERDTRKFVDRLNCNLRIPINTPIDELREAIRSLRSRNKRDAAAQREAPKRMRNAAQEVAALRRNQLRELRKTGTDDVAPSPNIVPVQTGFEGVSMPGQPAPPRRKKTKLADLATLTYGRDSSPVPKKTSSSGATLDLLAGQPLKDGDANCDDTDVDDSKPDLLSMVGGYRHD